MRLVGEMAEVLQTETDKRLKNFGTRNSLTLMYVRFRIGNIRKPLSERTRTYNINRSKLTGTQELSGISQRISRAPLDTLGGGGL